MSNARFQTGAYDHAVAHGSCRGMWYGMVESRQPDIGDADMYIKIMVLFVDEFIEYMY